MVEQQHPESRRSLVDGRLSSGLLGRLAGGIWIGTSILFCASVLVVPPSGSGARQWTLGILAFSLVSGAALRVLPWDRWPRRALLLTVPVGFAVIDLSFRFGDGNGYLYGITYMMFFVWIGMGQRQWTCLAVAPVLVVAYVAPLYGRGGRLAELGLASAILVVPACVMVGEALSWAMALLVESEADLAETRALYESSFESARNGIVLVAADGRLIRVNRSFGAIIGLDAASVRGRFLGEFVHPDDRGMSAEAIRQLIDGEIVDYEGERRYVTSQGRVVWVHISASRARDRSGAAPFVVGEVIDVTERRALREQLAYAAVHDGLTGLPNRTMLMERLERILARSVRTGHGVAVLFLDLDRFKLVNDGLGHDAGDRLLQRVARRLQGSLRPEDLVARFGGDEFCVVCDVTSASEASEIAQRLVRALDRPLMDGGGEQFISCSIGVALSGAEATTAATLLRQADVAMYRAKADGRARVAVYQEEDGLESMRSLQVTNQLHRALERDEFVLHYQPIVELAGSGLLGMEALVRWNHPNRGLLPPADFIPLAEDTGLIIPLGSWVIGEACRQGARWLELRHAHHQDPDRFNLSVNVATQQLADPGFPDVVAGALATTGFPAARLWLEITESSVLGHPNETVAMLERVRELGVHVAIDDFGTGYSSLGTIKQLPVELLKIDRTFTDDLESDADDQAIVKAVMALGQSLGLGVIAEGVERPSQVSDLRSLGCQAGQGFLFGRPQSAQSIGAFPADDLAGWAAAPRLAGV